MQHLSRKIISCPAMSKTSVKSVDMKFCTEFEFKTWHFEHENAVPVMRKHGVSKSCLNGISHFIKISIDGLHVKPLYTVIFLVLPKAERMYQIS